MEALQGAGNAVLDYVGVGCKRLPNNQSYTPGILDLVDRESVVDEQYEVSNDDDILC